MSVATAVALATQICACLSVERRLETCARSSELTTDIPSPPADGKGDGKGGMERGQEWKGNSVSYPTQLTGSLGPGSSVDRLPHAVARCFWDRFRDNNAKTPSLLSSLALGRCNVRSIVARLLAKRPIRVCGRNASNDHAAILGRRGWLPQAVARRRPSTCELAPFAPPVRGSACFGLANAQGAAMPRSRKILRTSRSGMPECRGTAEQRLWAGLPHREWRRPSRTRTHP